MLLLLSLEEETVLAITLLMGQGEGPDVTGTGTGMPRCILRHTAELMPDGDWCFSGVTAVSRRPQGRLRGLFPPWTRPTAKDAEFEVKPLSHYLDDKIHYPQSTKERHYLLLIYGKVSCVSQKCMGRHIYTP